MTLRAALAAALAMVTLSVVAAPVTGWLSWRGPHQTGVSDETGLPDVLSLEHPTLQWTYELAGRGTPVIAGDRVYAFGYEGDGPDLQEVLVCLDAATGNRHWEARFNDFLSDIVYSRYAIGGPTVDPETGNVYVVNCAGLFAAFTADGQKLWEHPLMDAIGRMTFPNGRNGSPAIDGDLVILHTMTSNWGKQGPARDRLYAYDKRTGELVWDCTPGTGPRDNSFALPVFANLGERRVLYVGLGCGNLACIDARTGQPLARVPFAAAGVNSTLIPYRNDTVIAIHGVENVDTSETGRMAAFRFGPMAPLGQEEPVVLTRDAELWRNPLGIFSSSGVLVGNRVYQTTTTGMLASVDADTGRVLWQEKLSYTQLHASPTWADGKLYVPMKDGLFYVIRPTDEKPEILSRLEVVGECLGAPAIWQGRIYLHTTGKLYCFGRADAPAPALPAPPPPPTPGAPVALQVVPAEVLLTPGQAVPLRVRALDANGLVVREVPPAELAWAPHVPAGARVQARLNAAIGADGRITAATANTPSAGMFKVTAGDLAGYLRGRVVSALPLREDFSQFKLQPHAIEEGVQFAYPPLPWIGARFKWEVREVGGDQVLAKTLDVPLFQRAFAFIGAPDMRHYTIAADVMSEGNRRMMSNVGIVNQRYLIALIGNWQILEISSNYERIKVALPYTWKPNVWYRIAARVDVAEDGSGVVRAKVWPRDEAEPAGWMLELPHRHAHPCGSPGFYGFTLQNQKRVYLDNLVVTPNTD